MPNQSPAKWLKINDFTPGISDNPGIAYPPGTAQRDSTYRCICSSVGALVPLPKQDASYDAPNYEGATVPDAGYYVINGFYVPPYTVVPTGAADPDLRYHPVILSVSYTTGGNYKQKFEVYRMWDNPHTNATFKALSAASGGNNGSGSFGASFGMTRANRASPTTPGIPVVAFSWGAANPALFLAAIYPDDAAPTVDGTFDITTSILTISTVHQGRIVLGQVTVYGFGPTGNGSTTENLYWTNVNNPGVLLAAPQSFVPENPNGYSVMFSMSANELFLLKLHGAVVLSGDLNDPTVINLPMVVGSSIPQTPTPSTVGLVYGNPESGVWAWSHGDSSQLLSPRMEPDFWTTAPALLTGIRYTFATWDDWVLVPNNWLYDTTTRSWWRLENPDTVAFIKYGRYTKFLYASPNTYKYPGGPTKGFYSFRRDQSASSFSWKSQPMWETVDRNITARQVTVRGMGVGSVDVTVTVQSGERDTATLIFEDDTTPVDKRGQIKVNGDAMTVTIVSTGRGSQPAPTVYEVDVQYYETSQVATS